MKQCIAYVDDQDVEAALNIGEMTLVKIRDCNAIFKNLVLEAREGGGGGGGGGGGEGSSGLSDRELEKQVVTLKNSLQQRDNEIAILVNMVKQGKKIPTDFTAGSAEAQAKSTYENVRKEVKDEKHQRSAPRRDLSEKEVSGVKICREMDILDDPARAFARFKECYPNNAALEENKMLLKAKYGLAKKTGEIVNKARSSINYSKKTIEQLRRERAMEGLTEGGNDEDEQEPHPEEQEHRKNIEREKTVYKENFQKLRELKNAIEHIQRLLEKSRGKMQTDFDAWYKVCMYQANKHNSSNISSSSNRSAFQSKETGNEENIENESNNNISQPKGGGEGGGGGGGGNVSGLPHGAKLTGNKEADDDIVAFYKAKEELLKKRNAGAK